MLTKSLEIKCLKFLISLASMIKLSSSASSSTILIKFVLVSIARCQHFYKSSLTKSQPPPRQYCKIRAMLAMTEQPLEGTLLWELSGVYYHCNQYSLFCRNSAESLLSLSLSLSLNFFYLSLNLSLYQESLC